MRRMLARLPVLALALALTLALAGCLTAERRAEEEEVERARAAVAPGYGPGTAAADILADPRADAELEARLVSGPSQEDVSEAVVRRNPEVQAALERYAAFLERVAQRTALPFPTVTYRYSTFDRVSMVEVDQQVPFPTKLLAEGRAALAAARAERAELEARHSALREQATRAYAALHLARRELAILDETLVLLDRVVEIARTRLATGAAPQTDVLRAEVERERLRARRADVTADEEVAASALSTLLDRSPAARIGPLAPLPEPAPPAAVDELLARATAARPELRGAIERTEASDAMVARAREEWIPDMMLGAAYVRDFGGDEDEVELAWGISLPLWWGRIGAGIAEAEAEARRARAELRTSRSRVLDETAAARARVAASVERHRRLTREALPRASANVRVSEEAYVVGSLDFLELVDAERQLLEVRLEAERALAEHAVRRAELNRAVGEAVK